MSLPGVKATAGMVTADSFYKVPFEQVPDLVAVGTRPRGAAPWCRRPSLPLAQAGTNRNIPFRASGPCPAAGACAAMLPGCALLLVRARRPLVSPPCFLALLLRRRALPMCPGTR